MQDWNDLRLVLAVTRGRNIAHAAKTLGIDHSTVFRRLNALEKKLGARLFERLPGGVYEALIIIGYTAHQKMEWDHQISRIHLCSGGDVPNSVDPLDESTRMPPLNTCTAPSVALLLCDVAADLGLS